MTTQIEAMKMALEELEDAARHTGFRSTAITALRAAIEAAEKMEPFGYVAFNKLHSVYDFERENDFDERYIGVTKVYLHPPSAEIEELRRDAARYRFMKQLDSGGIQVYDGPNDRSIFGSELDAAIDAAMQEKQP